MTSELYKMEAKIKIDEKIAKEKAQQERKKQLEERKQKLEEKKLRMEERKVQMAEKNGKWTRLKQRKFYLTKLRR